MRIGFECTTIAPGRSGIGRMAELLGSALAAEIAPSDELWALTNGEPPASLRPAPRGWPRRPTALWMQAVLPRIARGLGLDVYHFTNSVAPIWFEPPYVTTIHDASLVRLPHTHPLRRRLYQKTLLRRSARRARRVITISEASAADIVEFLGVSRERISITPLAAGEQFRPVRDPNALARIREKYGLGERFVLYVGNVEPRKNLERLVDAFAMQEDRDVGLAIAGGLAWMSDGVGRRIAERGMTDRVRMLGFVPDADLPALYSAARVFVYPSLWEGFGLPVLEAMACGAPVVTSNNSSLAEIARGAALLADPLSVDEIAGALHRALADDAERARLIEAGFERVARYSWAETARRTLAIYREVLAGE